VRSLGLSALIIFIMILIKMNWLQFKDLTPIITGGNLANGSKNWFDSVNENDFQTWEQRVLSNKGMVKIMNHWIGKSRQKFQLNYLLKLHLKLCTEKGIVLNLTNFLNKCHDIDRNYKTLRIKVLIYCSERLKKRTKNTNILFAHEHWSVKKYIKYRSKKR
jgi:hypothetical protein